MLFLRGLCPTIRNRGLHDVGHVGAATGRGAKPRQAFQGALPEPAVTFLRQAPFGCFGLTRRQSRRRCYRDVTLLASVPLLRLIP